MTGDMARHPRSHHETLLGAVSFGFFLLLLGALFISTPNLPDNIVTFLSHYQTIHVESLNVNVPIPEHLGDAVGLNVYVAARNFSLVWGIFMGVMLATRFVLSSKTRRKAQNSGDIAFWLGAAFLVQTLLVETTQATTINDRIWYEFWAGIIVLIGVSLIIRGIFLAVARAARSS